MEGEVSVLAAFTHVHNMPRVARQEYALAREHYREVCDHFDAVNPDHQRRFLDAAERLEVARERWLREMCE